MAEAFKHLIHAGTVLAMGRQLRRAQPMFDRQRFESLALDGLEALEFKARAMQLCQALEATLPAEFEAAAGALESSLAPIRADSDAPLSASADVGLAGWGLWAVGEFVARRGIDRPQRALSLLHALTQRFSAEFAIRPFIARHPELTFATLRGWTADPSAQVRRLVSEGSRPRLPWGMQLKALIADPSPTLPLLLALQDDPSDSVRRSVANHLNDIAKDHPELVAGWVEAHLPGASAQRIALLRHASRSLIKRGHPRTLQAWGHGQALRGDVDFSLGPKRATVGDNLTLQLTLRSRSRRAQSLAIDYAWFRRLADGSLAPKVFKGWKIELAAGETRTLVKRHSLRAVTTRRDYAGRHHLELRINGRACATAPFTLRLA